MKPPTTFRLAVLLLTGPLGFSHAESSLPTSVPVNAAYLERQLIDIRKDLVGAFRITDTVGVHLLTLTRTARPSHTSSDSERSEKIELLASFYSRSPHGKWKLDWTIRDMNDCPGLDGNANFFLHGVGFSDLDHNGSVEVTVPYYLHCAGGIEPSTVKVIMRQGPAKFAIRGESTIIYQGQEPFGGEHRFDDALLEPSNHIFKEHLKRIWTNVSVERR